MNPQLSAVFAFLAAIVLIGGGYSLLHHSGSGTSGLPSGADAATYQTLCPGPSAGAPASSCPYSKDKNWVYFDGTIVPGADATTFTIVDRFYAKDKNHVYYSSHGDGTPQIVPGDPSTFKNLGGDGLYSLDQSTVYWNNAPIPNADPSTFVEIYAEGVPTVYGKDATTVYHAGSATTADPNSFHIIKIDSTGENGGADGYGADDSNVFYDGSVVPGADPDTFVPPGTSDTTTSPPPTDTTPIATIPIGTTTDTSSTTTNPTQTQTTSGSTGIFKGFTLSSMPSGSTNAYYDPNSTIKSPNGF